MSTLKRFVTIRRTARDTSRDTSRDTARDTASTTPSTPPHPPPSPTPPPSSLHPSIVSHPLMFHLARLPFPHQYDITCLLPTSPCPSTARRASALRFSVVTAISNARDVSVVAHALDAYVPYALACWHLSDAMPHPPKAVLSWQSGLREVNTTEATGLRVAAGGLAMEAAFVVGLSALLPMRRIVETEANFGMLPDADLIDQIKTLQAAAGIMHYVRDHIAPKALADFSGVPPPEILPQVADLLADFALCLAQLLHVRRAATGGMSAATLAKLSAAANQQSAVLLSKHEAAIRAGALLNPSVKSAASHLALLARGWTLQYLAATTVTSNNCGAKVCALRCAIGLLKTASTSPMLGTLAALDILALQKQLDDTIGENRIVYQHAIPDINDLQLPLARSLVSPTPYHVPTIPKPQPVSPTPQ